MFATIAKISTMQILLSLVANPDWSLYQLHVKNVSFNDDLEEVFNMDIPPGFKNSSNINNLRRLRKCLHGLKQSPRFNKFIKNVKGRKQEERIGGKNSLCFSLIYENIHIQKLI